MSANLLPLNSTSWERCVADACAVPAELQAVVPQITLAKLVTRPASWLPFLIYENGLREAQQYLPNPYVLLDEGPEWQMLIGTVPAVDKGLGWLGYTATLEEASPARRFWNSFQLRFPSLPVNDKPDLERIEGITTISTPRRSRFRRGVHLYDVGPLEADHTRLDGSMLDWESGVKATNGTRFYPEGAIWSFGREHEFAHTLAQAEGETIGNWLEPVGDDAALHWTAMTYPWANAAFPWAASPEVQRRALMAGWFAGRVLYLCFRDTAGAVIGYRRCRAVRPVAVQADGVYAFGGTSYQPSPAGGRVYIEAMTQFEDADGVTAASVSLLVNAEQADGVKPGKLWLRPDELVGGQEIARHDVSIPLRRTVRDRVKILMRF
jgi:Phage tail protein (Tail_P2_I)